jgi:hypothetical protein
MTSLQTLVSAKPEQLARLGAGTPGGRRTGTTSASFDNRPTWDNWSRHRR